MGFLSKYTRTEKIDLGDGFWVVIKPNLSAAQKAAADDKLISSDGKGEGMQVGTGSYAIESAVQAIVSWNLTDENDVLLPVQSEADRRASLSHPLFPNFVVERIVKAIREADKQGSEGVAAFPAGGGAGTLGPGAASAVAAVGVQDGGSVLDTVRGEVVPGGPEPVA